MKLDIGPGQNPLPGYQTVDLYQPADYHCPMWKLPLADRSVAVIHSSHSLEHVSKFYVPETLREWRRVLIDGGELRLMVPDLDWVCRHWLAAPDEDFALDLIFGLQADDGQCHRTGFTAAILARHLAAAGFGPVSHGPVSSHAERGWEGHPPGRVLPIWSHGQQCLRVRCVV